MKKGMFILIEGTDCSGKETQSKRLVERLNNEGIKSVYLTNPNYDTPTGKIVGGPYLGKQEICDCYFEEGAVNVNPKVAALYYGADRLYNKNKIDHYLNEGYVIIQDRYVESNMAHQGGKITDSKKRNEMFEWLEELEYGLLDLNRPDVIYFLHMPYEFAVELKKNRTSLDGHEKSKEHLINAENAFLELKDKYGFEYINCTQENKIRSIEDINNEILDSVLEKYYKNINSR